jgi:hypothetical protein
VNSVLPERIWLKIATYTGDRRGGPRVGSRVLSIRRTSRAAFDIALAISNAAIA